MKRTWSPLRRTIRLGLLALLGLLLLVGVRVSGSSTAREARIVDLTAESGETRLLLSFTLQDAFEDLRKRIDSGLATELAYDYRLVRQKRWWFSETTASGRLRIIALYNSVTREYLINFEQNGELMESRIVRDIDALREAMTQVRHLPISLPETALQQIRAQPTKAQHTKIKVRAELGTRTRFFFIPATHTTEWAEAEEIAPLVTDLPDE